MLQSRLVFPVDTHLEADGRDEKYEYKKPLHSLFFGVFRSITTAAIKFEMPLLYILIALIPFVGAHAAFLDHVTPQSISWKQCEPLGLGVTLLQCATLEVPLDYDRPHEGNITLAIGRHSARDKSKRIGQLFYNPGGPGLLAINGLAATVLGGFFEKEILDRFDLMAVDLRGTGGSSPINCSAELAANLTKYSFLSSDASYESARKKNQAFRQSCLQLSGNKLIDFMDTATIAHDHEYVRRATCNERITWFGQSYGTQLAARYAELYPDALRAVLLDGPSDVSQDASALLAENAASQEAAINEFFAWCKKQNATICPLSHTKQSLQQNWQAMITKAAEQVGPSGPNAARFAVFNKLYVPIVGYPSTAQGINDYVYNNDDEFFASVFRPKADLSSVYNASSNYALPAVTCSDRPGDPSSADMKLKEELVGSQSYLMKGVSATLSAITVCVGWPKPRNPPHTLQIPRTNKDLKFMLVSNLYDPSTSSVWAQIMLHQIGTDRAALLMRNTGGHTAYFQLEASNGPTVAAMVRVCSHPHV